VRSIEDAPCRSLTRGASGSATDRICSSVTAGNRHARASAGAGVERRPARSL